MRPILIKREKYYLVLGILIAFYVQVFYDFIHEAVTTAPNSDTVWEGTQILIIIILSIIMLTLNKYLLPINNN
jgi:hypothetical protein